LIFFGDINLGKLDYVSDHCAPHRKRNAYNDRENALLGVFAMRKHATFKPRPLLVVGGRPTIVLIRERCLLFSQPSSLTDRVNNIQCILVTRILCRIFNIHAYLYAACIYCIIKYLLHKKCIQYSKLYLIFNCNLN